MPANQVLEHPDEACQTSRAPFEGVVITHVVAQRQIRMNRNVHETTEILQLQHTDQVVDVPVVLVVQVPRVQVVAKTIEIPQSLFGEKIAAIPEARTVQGTQTSKSFTVAGKFHREILMRGVAPNIEAGSFIDDLGSVGSKRLNHQDCDVLFHASMKRITQQPDSSQQQQQGNQPQAARKSTRQERKKEGRERGQSEEEEKGREEREMVRKGERGKEEEEGTLRKKSASRLRRT